MARAKKPAPALYAVRDGFADALEATVSAATEMLLTLRTAFQLEQIKPGAADLIRQSARKLDVALSGDDELMRDI